MTDAKPITGYISEVEQGVLGSLLFGGDLRKVRGFLRDYHFIADVHVLLYRTICAAHEQYGSTTVPVVARLLPEDATTGFMARTGMSAVAYMASLSEFNVTGNLRLEESGWAVVRQWVRLKAGEEGLRLHAAANDPLTDPSVLIKTMVSDLSDMAGDLRRGRQRKTLISLSDAAENAFAKAEEARQKGTGVSGVTWGLSDVNRVTGGIHNEFVLIGARPSMGKTAFGLSCAIKTAKSGVGVGFISLEMGSTSLANRAITDIAYDWNIKIAYSDLGKGKLEENDIEALRSATRELNRIPLWIEEQAGLSLADIRVKADQMMETAEKAGSPIKVFVIDYLGLIKPAARYSGNRVAEVSEISAGLKDFSRECGVGVIALSQLSRQVESRDDKRPQLSDLRDSGALEQDADMIAFLFREAYYIERAAAKSADDEADRIDRLANCQNKLEFIVAKQRNGPVRTVDLFVDIACSAVRNGERSYGHH